jgi:co-chaperonin GroES (HSP10)
MSQQIRPLGNRILLRRREVSLDGETLVIVTEEDLLGVVEGAA